MAVTHSTAPDQQAKPRLERPETPRENWDIGWRWLTGGDPSLGNRLRDAIRLVVAMATGVVAQHPVRVHGDEAWRRLPGDELVPARAQWTNGVTIHARPSEIWPWLVQMGCRRAGVYSYDGLDNGGIPSAHRIIPEFQHVEVGDVLPWTPTADDGFIVRAVEPERALVLGEETGSMSWAFVLEPIDDDKHPPRHPRQGVVQDARKPTDARTRLPPDPLRHAATTAAQSQAARRGGGTLRRPARGRSPASLPTRRLAIEPLDRTVRTRSFKPAAIVDHWARSRAGDRGPAGGQLSLEDL